MTQQACSLPSRPSGGRINNTLKLVLKGQAKLWLACLLIAASVFLLVSDSIAVSSFLSKDVAVHRAFGTLIATLSGTLAAVLVTGLALAFTLPDRPLMQSMRASGHFLDLCANILSAIMGSIIVTLIATILSIANETATWLNLLIGCAIPLSVLLLQAAARFVLTLIGVASSH